VPSGGLSPRRSAVVNTLTSRSTISFRIFALQHRPMSGRAVYSADSRTRSHFCNSAYKSVIEHGDSQWGDRVRAVPVCYPVCNRRRCASHTLASAFRRDRTRQFHVDSRRFTPPHIPEQQRTSIASGETANSTA
jgi:hypothetical protein